MSVAHGSSGRLELLRRIWAGKSTKTFSELSEHADQLRAQTADVKTPHGSTEAAQAANSDAAKTVPPVGV